MFERIIIPLVATAICLLCGIGGVFLAGIVWWGAIKSAEDDVKVYSNKEEAANVVMSMKLIAGVVLFIALVIALGAGS